MLYSVKQLVFAKDISDAYKDAKADMSHNISSEKNIKSFQTKPKRSNILFIETCKQMSTENHY